MDDRLSRRTTVLVASFLALAFVASRVTALAHRIILADNDSAGYLTQAQHLVSQGWAAYLGLLPDATPAYPFSIALITAATGITPALAGRMISLGASALIATLVFSTATLLFSRRTGLIALALVVVSAPLTYWAVSILTEPLFVALVHLGLYLFLAHYLVGRKAEVGGEAGESLAPGSPALRWGAALGAIFAIAFLTRFEGVIYLALVPFWAGLLLVANGSIRTGWRRWLAWSAAFGITFAILSAPQVLKVSTQAGTFMLNGRQVWSAVLNAPGPESYEERIYGLDYADDQVNIDYLQLHPDVLSNEPLDIVGTLALLSANSEEALDGRLPELFGLFTIVLAAFGLMALMRRPHRRFTVPVILTFFILSTVPSLLHNVTLRHLMILVPLGLVLAAEGVLETARAIGVGKRWERAWIGAGVLLVLLPAVPNLVRIHARPYATPTWAPAAYDPRTYEPLIVDLHAVTDDPQSVVVATRQGFFTHHASSRRVPVPYADYPSLVRFLERVDADYLLMESNLGHFPFASEFETAPPPDFERFSPDEGPDAGGPVLYRFRPGAGVAAPESGSGAPGD
ncbi:MAG: hypothetical protein WEG36_08360 [Gemmatimonadota bacterium]